MILQEEFAGQHKAELRAETDRLRVRADQLEAEAAAAEALGDPVALHAEADSLWEEARVQWGRKDVDGHLIQQRSMQVRDRAEQAAQAPRLREAVEACRAEAWVLARALGELT